MRRLWRALSVAIICSAIVSWQAAGFAQTTDQELATLYVFNASGWTVFGSPVTVKDNGEAIGRIDRNEYLTKHVPPGRHVLKTDIGRELVIQAVAGETYYVKYAYTPSIIAWLSTTTFAQISKDEAQKLMTQMTAAAPQPQATPVQTPPAHAEVTATTQRTGTQAQLIMEIVVPAGEAHQAVKVVATSLDGAAKTVYEGVHVPGARVSASASGTPPFVVLVYVAGVMVKQITVSAEDAI